MTHIFDAIKDLRIFHFGEFSWKFLYIQHPCHIIETEPHSWFRTFANWRKFEKELKYEEALIRIVDTKDQTLRWRTLPYVKVEWSNHTERNATWNYNRRCESNTLTFSRITQIWRLGYHLNVTSWDRGEPSSDIVSQLHNRRTTSFIVIK